MPIIKVPVKPLKNSHAQLLDPDYTPERLLDGLLLQLNLKNDAALCRALQVSPPVLSKLRQRRLPVSAGLLLRMHEITALPVAQLRAMMVRPAQA